MTLPARPIFQNGQRLTADRLTQAVEFLRTFIRRLALAPLGSGVAAGLQIGNDFQGRVVVSPGVAIDGRGRLLVLETEQLFTVAEVEGQAGTIAPGGAVRVTLIGSDSLPGGIDPCAQAPATVVESVSVRFSSTLIPTGLDSPFSADLSPYCVNPWGDLDGPAGGCGVALGDMVRLDGTGWTASLRSRQGVSAELGAVRSPTGHIAMTLGQMNLDLGSGAFVREAIAFATAAEFENDVRIRGAVRVASLRGDSVQATTVAPLAGQGAPTAGVYAENSRVFALSGGANTTQVPDGQGGLSAVLVELDTSGGMVDAPGQPLYSVAPDVGNPRVRVKRGTGESTLLIGLSAERAHFVPSTGRHVVPVATAGLVRVVVDSAGLNTGSYLAAAGTLGRVTFCNPGTTAVARLAENATLIGDSAYAWVVHPAFKLP